MLSYFPRVKNLSLVLSAVLLAGCQVSGPSNFNRPVQPQQTGVSGNWIGTDGVAISTFQGGGFASYAVDTGSQLAAGNYNTPDGQNVQIALRSLIRGTTTQVNCLLVNAQQMNCTTQTGAQFSLLRTNQRPPVPQPVVQQPAPTPVLPS